MIDLLDRMLLFPRLFHTGRPCPERACTTNVAAGCGKGDEMFDKILKVIRITGEFVNFYAIVYLEDGIYPSTM